MLNSVILIGRLTKDIEVQKLESGKEVSRVSLAVNRSFKNADGIYEVDFFDCVLWDGIAKTAMEYCGKGDTVGVRGRLQSSNYEKDGIKRKAVDIIVEKLTFLTSKKTDVKEVDE